MGDKFWQLKPLTFDNYDQWIRGLETLDMREDHPFDEYFERNITLDTNASPDDKRNHKVARKSAIFAIEQSLSDNIRSLIPPDLFTSQEPFDIITKIKSVMGSNPHNNPSLLFSKTTSSRRTIFLYKGTQQNQATTIDMQLPWNSEPRILRGPYYKWTERPILQ